MLVTSALRSNWVDSTTIDIDHPPKKRLIRKKRQARADKTKSALFYFLFFFPAAPDGRATTPREVGGEGRLLQRPQEAPPLLVRGGRNDPGLGLPRRNAGLGGGQRCVEDFKTVPCLPTLSSPQKTGQLPPRAPPLPPLWAFPPLHGRD